jgi:hypothetical protein
MMVETPRTRCETETGKDKQRNRGCSAPRGVGEWSENHSGTAVLGTGVEEPAYDSVPKNSQRHRPCFFITWSVAAK